MVSSWDDSISPSLGPPVPHLTHLSLSHPPPTISWPRLLAFAKHVPALTHLSLAHWPVPSLTPNAKTAVVSSPHGKDIQYGGTGYYSHLIDNDYREAGNIFKRLAHDLYNLEYLNLEGCADWLPALRWTDSPEALLPGRVNSEGIDWHTQWLKLNVLVVRCGFVLHEDSEFWEVKCFHDDYQKTFIMQTYLSKIRKAKWIDVVRDDTSVYEEWWKDGSEESQKKRKLFEDSRTWKWTSQDLHGEFHADADASMAATERRSIWEQ